MGNKHAKVKAKQERTLDTEDLDFLRTNTNFDEKTIREWHRGFYEDCPSGKLSPKKFMEVYKVFFPGGNAESFCDHVFRTFDQDKSGYIDFKEFLLAINVTSSGTPEQKLHWAFRMYDIDGNGTIDRREMTRIIQAIYEMLGTDSNGADGAESPQERSSRIFEKMDTNHDSVLSKEEFIKGCMEDEDLRQMLASATGGGTI